MTAQGQPSLQLLGERQTGQDVRTENVTAAMAIANVIRTSFGPVGLDKMLVDDVGEVTVTNDGATILKQLEIEHPAARILVQLAELQDQEVGDGTSSVVLFAAELLSRANTLVRQKIHPTTIMSGLRIAQKECRNFLEKKFAIPIDEINDQALVNVARTSMSSKIIGVDSDFFSQICVEAMQSVKTKDGQGRTRYPVKSVNILKAHGKSVRESQLIKGYGINSGRAAQGLPKSVKNAKIACLDINLQKSRLAMGMQVVIEDVNELEKIRERESDITKEKVQKILGAGANVVLTTKGIDDTCMKYFVDNGVYAVRRVPKDDMKRVVRATGATLVVSLADEDGNESYDSSLLGHADEICEQKVSDDDVTIIKGAKNMSAVTLLLRGANDTMLDEVDRSLHDALCTVKRVLESGTVVPGGGAAEAALSQHLEHVTESIGGRENLAIAQFAESLLVIPKTLASNAAKDTAELVSKLKAYHYKSQNEESQKSKAQYGLDLINGKVVNNVEAGVLEPTQSKVKMIQFATEAAITILRIDDMIKLEKDPTDEREED